jgi:hypothetical protein
MATRALDNGTLVTLGLIGVVAAAGLVSQRRGSRDEEVASLVRGVLRLPGRAPIKVKKLGAGSFATAYVTTEESPPVVYVLTPDDVYDKELLAMARDAEPQNPHLPKVEKVGETRDQFIYAMPLYRAPLRKGDSPAGWKDYLVLKKCREEAWRDIERKGTTYEERVEPIPPSLRGMFMEERETTTRRIPTRPDMTHRGYEVNEATVACAERSGVSPSTLDALRILVDTASNYGSSFVFEFAPRNLASDEAGNMVLLDPLFDQEKLRAKRQRERKELERKERDRMYGRRW